MTDPVRDIIRDAMLALVRRLIANDASITEEEALRAMVEADPEVRAYWGGNEVRVPKTPDRKAGRPSTPAAVAQQAYADALTDKPTEDILKDRAISRATLYRLLKKGPPAG